MTMTAPASRPELPSRGEIWSILLGTLLAGVLLASAFRLSVTVRAPVVEDAALDRGGSAVVVRPEPHVAPAAAPRPARPVMDLTVASR